MELVKIYNIGKNTTFNLSQLGYDIAAGTYTIKSQAASVGGAWSAESNGVQYTVVDPYNPLGLPTFTIRCRFNDGYTPTMGDSQTLVDSNHNIWDITKNSTDWSELFYIEDPSPLIGVLGANTTSVTNMSNLFRNSAILGMLYDMPLFDTSSVTNMSYMFYQCSGLESVPLYDTSSVTNMSAMFGECLALTTIPLLNTSHVTNVDEMLANCHNLQSGALALYTQMSTQEPPPLTHVNTFANIRNSEELAQIPESWGGTMAES